MTSAAEVSAQRLDTVVFDLDGTLVDSVYQHTRAWKRAFVDVGIQPESWRIHRSIGMGGDRLVTEVAGATVERTVGDELRKLHGRYFEEAIGEVTVLPGVCELLDELVHRDLKMVLATSGKQSVTDRLLDLLDNRSLLDAWLPGSQVDSSKPAPDLIEEAVRRVEGARAIVIGDSIWDVKAAAAAGHDCIGLLTGGTSAAELREAGASQIFVSASDLLAQLDHTTLG